jgi:ribosomal-protein-alanine N-acetyltransferase
MNWEALGAIGTVLGAVGAIIALALIYSQISQARKQLAHTREQITFDRERASYEYLRKEDDRFRSEEMRRNRSNLAKALLLYPENYNELNKYADYVLDYFVDLGLLLGKGLADEYFIWSMNCYYILRYWKASEQYIKMAREIEDDPTYFIDFEDLYEKMVEFDKKMTKKTIELTSDYIKDFLKDEILVELRHYIPPDLDHIMIIEKLSFSEAEAYPRSQFEELYNEHPEGFFVAEIPGQVVGYVIGYVSDKLGEIDSIAVTPTYRQLGIGKKLMEIILESFRERNIKKCSLEVRTTNDVAISFHKKYGFEIEKTIANYYEDGADAYVMTMEIE